MPTLPLFDPDASPDAAHCVTAPGGYEWRQLNAESAAGDVRIVAAVYEGYPLHPKYLARYRRYRRFPAHFRPPVPREFPCVTFSLYEVGKSRAGFVWQASPGEDAPLVTRLRGRSSAGEFITTDLSVRPLRSSSLELRPFPPALRTPEHCWLIPMPICDVSGEIAIDSRVIAFEGRGFAEHHYGSGLLERGVKSWLRGHATFEDSTVVVFSRAVARSVSISRSLEIRGETIQEIDASEITIDRPKVFDSSPSLTRSTCQATYKGQHGVAWCESFHPPRWPWLRMLSRRR